MRQFRTFIIIAFNTLVLLLLVEVLLRVIYPRKNSIPETNIAYQSDPDYLVSLKPNIKKEFIRSKENGGDTILWATNEHGFRGTSLKKSELTIAVYGDSNIQARFSELDKTYVKRLEYHLARNSQHSISVVNGGVVGHGPDQSYLKFMKEKSIIEPDIVLLNVFADNDFGDFLRNKLLKLSDMGELVVSKDQKPLDRVLDTTLTHKWYHLRLIDAVRRLRQKLFGNQELSPEYVITTYSKVSEEEFQNYKGTSDHYYSNFEDHYDIDVAVNPESKSSSLKSQLMEALLKKFKNQTLESNIKFIVLIQPSSIDISKNYLINYEDIVERYPNYKKDRLTSIVENICIDNGIHYINLFETFKTENPGKHYFVGGNNHWNDFGQEIAAKITADYISDSIRIDLGSK